MDTFPSSEEQINSHFVIAIKKLFHLAEFDLQVVFFDFGFYPQLPNTRCMLSFASFLPLFLHFEFEAAIIHNFADRWVCIRWNFHQIKAGVNRSCKGFFDRYNTDLFSVRVDYPDFFCSNSLININVVRSVRPMGSSWKSYVSTSYARVVSMDYSGINSMLKRPARHSNSG